MRRTAWMLASVGMFAIEAAVAAQLAAPAGVATAAVAEDAKAEVTAEIVVTGSRIDRAGFTAPTPTTVVGAATLEQRAAVNIADVLNEVPAFRRTSAPEAGGIGNRGLNSVDLRGLTPVRTLVLLDKLRLPGATFPGQTIAGVPDLNTIPTVLIAQADVVTGGASAAYGSDAVAGVVNLQINTKLEGIKGNVQYGQSRYNDAQDYFASLAAGTGFAGGRGHVVIGGEYNKNDGTDLFNTRRPWGQRNVGLVSVSGVRPADVPANLVAENVLFGVLTPGGLITPTVASNPVALRNLQFVANADGTVTTAPFNAGLYQGQVGSSMVGGSNVNPYQVLRARTERWNMLAEAHYDISDNVTVWIEPSFSRFISYNISAQIRAAVGGTGPFLVFRPDNAYLRQALTPAQQALVPAGGLSIGYLGNDFGPARVRLENDVARLVGGFKGKFGDNWRWDVSGQYARSVSRQDTSVAPITANFNAAIDAVQVTAANVGSSGLALGSIVCRSALTTPTNGCVPLNILGRANPSAAALAYSFGTSNARTVSTLTEFVANLNGEPFSLWAGPVSVGVGAEYRRDTLQTGVDAISQAGQFGVQVARNFPLAAQSVKEAYAEVIVPLLAADSFPGELNFNGAARITDYSLSGSVTTWKTGLTWKPVPDLLLRGTLSRDIRAPTLPELLTPNVASLPRPLTQGATADLRTAFVGQAYAFDTFTGGSTALTPEKADTLTAGAVFTPSGLGNRLQVSIDFYRINVKNAIGALGAATSIQNCTAGGVASASNPFCGLITFTNNDLVNGRILSVNAANANFAEFKTKGFDFAVRYVQPLDAISPSLPGRVSLTAQATHVLEYRASTDISVLYPNGVDRAGQTGALFGGTPGLPNWVVNATLDYRVGKFDINGQLRWISESRQNNALIGPDQPNYSPTLFNSINNNVIPSVAYFNLGMSYDLALGGNRTELYFTVNNLFNRAPPLPAINNNAWYDLLGRTYRLGLRFGF